MGNRIVNNINDPLKENYYAFVAAIYKQAVDDAIEQCCTDAANARRFLKNNPYGLNVDFDSIITKLQEEKKQ